MIYDTGYDKIDKSRTTIKLNSNYELYHEFAQFIENYARATFGENWDMSKLHFYNSDPAKGNAEVPATEAFEQLTAGYPIFVKHEDSPDVLPFMKRGINIYTGQDFLKEKKHPDLDLGFDYKEFMKAPVPPRPSAWQYILGFFGMGGDTYRNYKAYEQKLQTVQNNEYAIKRLEAEDDGYKYATEIAEKRGFAQDVKRISKTPLETLKNAKAAEKYEKVLTVEEAENGPALNIDELLEQADPKVNMGDPEVPEEIQEELDARDAAIEMREQMKKSKFMKDVAEEILLNPEADEEELIRAADFIRTMHNDVPENISTKEYVEYAKVLLMTERKLDAGDAAMEAYRIDRFNRFGDKIATAITEQLMKEQEGLDKEETYKTVRFGPTLKKMMTAKKDYPRKLAQLGVEDPAKLTNKYKEQVDKLAAKEAKIKEEAAAKLKGPEKGADEAKAKAPAEIKVPVKGNDKVLG